MATTTPSDLDPHTDRPAAWLTTAEVEVRYGVKLTQDNLDPHQRFFIRSKLVAGPGMPRVWLREDVEFHCPKMAAEQNEKEIAERIHAQYDKDRKARAEYWQTIRMREP